MSNNYKENFALENYTKITGLMLNSRVDPFIREKEKKEGPNKGLIFSFARGLRFSSQLIYAIRKTLENPDLEANWGQVLDDEWVNCSGECDIIIHQKNPSIQRWNGDGSGHDVMDFRFVPRKLVKAVISCKSFIVRNDIDIEYCENMRKYVDRVWLFAECCGPESSATIHGECAKVGYENFWHLYAWSRTTGDTYLNEQGWLDFIKAVRSL